MLSPFEVTSPSLSDAPENYRVSQDRGALRIRTILHPPILLNLFLIIWIIPWTCYTTYLYGVCLGFFEPLDEGRSALGQAIAFSFFWCMVFVILLFVNFVVMEWRLYATCFEERFGLPGLVLQAIISEESIDRVAITKRTTHGDDNSGPQVDSWTLCIYGAIERKIVLLGAYTLVSWTSKTTHWVVETEWKVEKLLWLGTVLMKWCGKPLQLP